MRVNVGSLMKDHNTIATFDQEKDDTFNTTFEEVFTIEDTSQMLQVPYKECKACVKDNCKQIRESEISLRT